MKKIILAFIIILVSNYNLFSKGKNDCVVQGVISNPTGNALLIRVLTNPVFDTIKLVNNGFTFTTEMKEVAPMVISDDQNHYQLFFAEPGAKLKIGLDQKAMQITSIEGSKSHVVFQKLIQSQEPLQQVAAKVQADYGKPESNKDSLTKAMTAINEQLKNNYYNFLKENGNSEVTAFVIFSSISQERNVSTATADSMMSFLTGKARTSFYGKEMNKMVMKLKAVEVGNMAPDFTLADSSGKKTYSLSSFQGKYVLVDFWASWCGPCKQEIPFLKTAYTNFHDKGFEIVSVSLDDKRQAWLSALQQFKMPWIQISDSKGFSSLVNELYHIPSIPKTLLLDKTGKIIATDLRGPALDEKLAELLK